jgi:hypothetical protein
VSAALAQLPVDAVFAVRGTAATYTAPGGGEPVPCTVIRESRDREFGGLSGRATMQGNVIKVRKSEIAAPAKGGTFTVLASAETVAIADDPRCEDNLRLVWTCTAAGG